MFQFKRVQFKSQFVFYGEVVREAQNATYDSSAGTVTFLVGNRPCVKPWADVEFAEPTLEGVKVRERSEPRKKA